MTFSLDRGTAPLLVSMPHVGTGIPDDLRQRLRAARAVGGRHGLAPRPVVRFCRRALGASVLRPRLSRYVIDLNRPPDDAPMYPGASNTELCPTRFFTGEPLYRDGLRAVGCRARQPSRSVLAPVPRCVALGDRAHPRRHGFVLLWDAHSIRSAIPWLFEGRLPDLNIGTAGGASAHPAVAHAVADAAARHRGFTHVVNGRFKGGYITRRYGDPARGVHAVQLEMCQCLYMSEQSPYGYDERARRARAAAGARDGDGGPGGGAGRAWPHSDAPSSRPRAWVNGAWASDVLLAVDGTGRWSRIEIGADALARQGAQQLSGPVLPGLVNGHSHAFQRAMAGLTERSGGADDDFWHWRDRMYSVANRISPEQLEAIAVFLYAELLSAGYTQVCEFHYLHNDTAGRPYARPAEMALALVRAARRAGIGLTLLPTLYMRSGFAAGGLREDQRRFASTPESVLDIAQAVARLGGSGHIGVGVALHSLRAVDEGALRELADAAGPSMPVHIHIAEQRLEVDDCIARHGRRPIEWLLENVPVDERWNLVHATHATPQELEGVRGRRATIVLCPGTEANLGDGVFDLPAGWARAATGPSARTARSRAAGRKSCACSNTRSAWPCASATWRRAQR